MVPPFRWPVAALEHSALQEPLSPDSALWDMENLLLSPHNADLTPTHRTGGGGFTGGFTREYLWNIYGISMEYLWNMMVFKFSMAISGSD